MDVRLAFYILFFVFLYFNFLSFYLFIFLFLGFIVLFLYLRILFLERWLTFHGGMVYLYTDLMIESVTL